MDNLRVHFHISTMIPTTRSVLVQIGINRGAPQLGIIQWINVGATVKVRLIQVKPLLSGTHLHIKLQKRVMSGNKCNHPTSIIFMKMLYIKF